MMTVSNGGRPHATHTTINLCVASYNTIELHERPHSKYNLINSMFCLCVCYMHCCVPIKYTHYGMKRMMILCRICV